MKVLKILVITLVATFLTGCYTQLQYSQTVKKVSEKNSRSAYADKQRTNYEGSKSADTRYYSDEYGYEGDYIPLYYKDYETARYWENCGCNPYATYNFYGDNYFSSYYGGWNNYYRPHYGYGFTMDPYYAWHMNRYFSPSYFGSSFGFSIFWGSGYHYRGYYDPFYHDFYWSRYHNPYAYTYYQYYGTHGNGIYYNKDKKDQKVRYGLRSIGTDRVANNVNRSRNSRNISRRSTGINSSRSKVRIRSSVGSSRIRGTVTRNSGSSVRQNRSRGTVNSSSRTESRTRGRLNIQNKDRSRGDVKNEDRGRRASNGILRVRSLDLSNSLEGLSKKQPGTDQRLRKAIGADVSKNIRNNNPIFFKKIKGYFKRTGQRISNNVGSSRSSFGSRFRSTTNNRSTIRRSTGNSSSRSTVTRSRSSSTNSKSRSRGSSSSRSRGGNNGGSSSSDRGRGNN